MLGIWSDIGEIRFSLVCLAFKAGDESVDEQADDEETSDDGEREDLVKLRLNWGEDMRSNSFLDASSFGHWYWPASEDVWWLFDVLLLL